jgi:hypothetical protein
MLAIGRAFGLTRTLYAVDVLGALTTAPAAAVVATLKLDAAGLTGARTAPIDTRIVLTALATAPAAAVVAADAICAGRSADADTGALDTRLCLWAIPTGAVASVVAAGPLLAARLARRSAWFAIGGVIWVPGPSEGRRRARGLVRSDKAESSRAWRGLPATRGQKGHPEPACHAQRAARRAPSRHTDLWVLFRLMCGFAVYRK